MTPAPNRRGAGVGQVLKRASVLVLLAGFACGGVQGPRVAYESEEPFPTEAEALLVESLRAARDVPDHPWRDRSARPTAEVVRTRVETPKGAKEIRRLDLKTGRLRVDRSVAPRVGPIPVNRGFIPQSFAFDGDPLDALVLGPPVSSGREVVGRVVGVLHIQDEGIPDPQLVVVPIRSPVRLSTMDKHAVARWFEAFLGQRAKVTSWGDAEDASRILERALGFFDRGYRAFLDGKASELGAP